MPKQRKQNLMTRARSLRRLSGEISHVFVCSNSVHRRYCGNIIVHVIICIHFMTFVLYKKIN